jgi:hypothetical protein
MKDIKISELFLSAIAAFFSCSMCFDIIFDYLIVIGVIIKIISLTFFIISWYFFCCVLTFYYGLRVRQLFSKRNFTSYFSVILSRFYYLDILCLAGAVIFMCIPAILIYNGNYWLERYTIHFEKPILLGIPIIFLISSFINFFIIPISYKSIIGLLCNSLWAIASIASAITLICITAQL